MTIYPEDEARGLPPGPMCEVCGHDLCPCCPLPWCDIVTDDELCCDSECRVAWDDYLEWQLELREVGGFEAFEGWTQVAEGPWFPAAERRARGVARWYPPPVFAQAPRVVPLLARVLLWQRRRQLRYTDGLIGPETWARRDDDLLAAARELARELRAAHLGDTQLARFLMGVLPP